MKHILSTLFIISAAFAVTGCNTMEGLGQDLEDGGEAIEDAAEDAS